MKVLNQPLSSGTAHPAVFITAALGVCFVSWSVLAGPFDARSMEIAATLDLTVTIPAVYWFLLARGRGWSPVTILPVYLGGLLLASLILPADRQATLHAMKLLAIPIELSLVGIIMHRTVRAISHGRSLSDKDMLERIGASVREVVPNTRAAGIVASEATVLAYAFFPWRRRSTDHTGPTSFTYHRRSGYGALAGGLLIAIAIEIIPVHALLAEWSGTAAWIVTGLSVYGAIWVIGDYRAIKHRPIVIVDDHLVIRHGLRWNMRIPVDRIAAVEPVGGPVSDYPVDLRLVLPGARRLLIGLDRSVDAVGLYGMRRRVTMFELGVDDPVRMAAALRDRGPASSELARGGK